MGESLGLPLTDCQLQCTIMLHTLYYNASFEMVSRTCTSVALAIAYRDLLRLQRGIIIE